MPARNFVSISTGVDTVSLAAICKLKLVGAESDREPFGARIVTGIVNAWSVLGVDLAVTVNDSPSLIESSVIATSMPGLPLFTYQIWNSVSSPSLTCILESNS